MPASTSALPAPTKDGTANGFKMPRSTKSLARPTWFNSTSSSTAAPNMEMRHTPLGPTSSSSSSGSATSFHSASTLGFSSKPKPAAAFAASPGNPFATTAIRQATKHRLSPSPSPNKASTGPDEDFVMISPVHSSLPHLSPQSRRLADLSSSPIEESPTPACGMANAAARLRLADEESPIRVGAASGFGGGRLGCPPSPLKFTSGNLAAVALMDGEGSPMGIEEDCRPIPQPHFPLPRSHSQELRSRPGLFALTKPTRTGDETKIPRLSASHPLRARASTGSQMDHERTLLAQTQGQKKAISLDRIQAAMVDKDEAFGSIAAPAAALGHARRTSKGQMLGRHVHKRVNSGEHLSTTQQASMSRSAGHKSGLALSLGGLPDFSLSNSSLSSLSTNNMPTPPAPPSTTFSPAEPPIFEDVKPLQAAFEQPHAALRKFKPRDSGVSVGDEGARLKIPPPSVLRPSASGAGAGGGVGQRPRRPPMLKRTSSMGDQSQFQSQSQSQSQSSLHSQPFLQGTQRPLETPIEPNHSSGWPSTSAFNFLGENGLPLALRLTEEEKPEMPGTPVKRNHLGGGMAGRRRGMGHSSSQPSLGSSAAAAFGSMSFGTGEDEVMLDDSQHGKGRKTVAHPPPTMRKKSGTMGSLGMGGGIPHLTLTSAGGTGGGASSSPERGGDISPTVRGMMMLGTGTGPGTGGKGGKSGLGALGRMSNSGSESDGTPTKGGGEKVALAAGRPDMSLGMTPSKPPLSTSATATNSSTTSAAQRQPPVKSASSSSSSSIYPRMSLPAFSNPKMHRTLHHRQSHPATKPLVEDENIFEGRFIMLETLGKGAFSTVVKVQERNGEGLWAVKKARGVFDGVRDRLRHLEEVDILRHLSSPLASGPNAHVIRFQDAWEQNRQLFIQTELCLGTLAFFLEEYGRVVERLDEGRVWKIVRELSDGLHHIHQAGIVHFDLKPANILISDVGTLKIGDFGMASRVPRVSPAEILKGAGLGGNAGTGSELGLGSSGGWEKLEREGDRVYMPPEMLRGVFGMSADIFSFGLVILEVSTNICVPDGGPAWHSLRTDDFSVVDLSPLSPALADLITNCMASDPTKRPTTGDIVSHPVIVRAGSGGAALAPESRAWLSGVLGGFDLGRQMVEEVSQGDVEMLE